MTREYSKQNLDIGTFIDYFKADYKFIYKLHECLVDLSRNGTGQCSVDALRKGI